MMRSVDAKVQSIEANETFVPSSMELSKESKMITRTQYKLAVYAGRSVDR